MWPFFRRPNQPTTGNTQSGTVVARPQPLKFAQIIKGMGDCNEMVEHDVALKFWLPEPAVEALRDLCGRNGDSVSEALRQFFAQHCYGIYAFQVMCEASPRLFKDPHPPLFSLDKGEPTKATYKKKRIDTYWVPELGKNVIAIKVWIPNRMRRDLQILADHVGLKLSQYAREIIISRLLGHGALPSRPEMLEAVPLPSAEAWCADRKVQMRQVDSDQFYRQGEGEHRTEWVDP